MKIKELTFASVFLALLVAQNYILYSFPITLTYPILFFIGSKVKSRSIKNIGVLAYVGVKNIIYTALPLTILADVLGLLLFINISSVRAKGFQYFLFVVVIVFHLLLLDLSTALMMGSPIFPLLIGQITTGFITYLYAPASVLLIIVFDVIKIISEYEI